MLDLIAGLFADVGRASTPPAGTISAQVASCPLRIFCGKIHSLSSSLRRSDLAILNLVRSLADVAVSVSPIPRVCIKPQAYLRQFLPFDGCGRRSLYLASSSSSVLLAVQPPPRPQLHLVNVSSDCLRPDLVASVSDPLPLISLLKRCPARLRPRQYQVHSRARSFGIDIALRNEAVPVLGSATPYTYHLK